MKANGEAQHHDAITGTAYSYVSALEDLVTDNVTAEYEDNLNAAIDYSLKVCKSRLSEP